MNITIYGCGYVGLVTGACFADMGNQVLGVEVDAEKLASLRDGRSPIHEAGLESLIVRNMEAGRLRFSNNLDEGVDDGVFQFIAVGTPPNPDGSADLRYVLELARELGQRIKEYKIVVTKSTVPVGTSERVHNIIETQLSLRKRDIAFDTVANPEFLKEGMAVEDFMHPDRVVVGASSTAAIEQLRTLYEPFIDNPDQFIVMDPRSAELTKYAANAMLATRISFINEIAAIADKVGADVEQVRIGIGSDPRIGREFIRPGPGFGGSCFPKDLQALRYLAQEHGVHEQLLRAVQEVNDRQKRVMLEKIKEYWGDDLKGKTIALWGLAFKPETDDMRDAPSRVLMEGLWELGVKVQAYDPAAMDNTRKLYPNQNQLHLVDDAYAALNQADTLVVMTEWKEFRSPDFERIREALRTPVIFDARNLFDPQIVVSHGLDYFSIGRPEQSRRHPLSVVKTQ